MTVFCEGAAPRRVLVLGRGGREYAYCQRVAACATVLEVHVYPGGDAFSLLPKVTSWPDAALDASNVVGFAQKLNIELVLIGGAWWMGHGWADALRAAGIAVVGAGRESAALERSKRFGQDFMARHGLRTPATRAYASLEAAAVGLSVATFPVVVKTDGPDDSHLQTRICADGDQAMSACAHAIHPGEPGRGSGVALVQDFVPGWDLAVSVALDETHHVILPACREYKRLSSMEMGINTCGMGTYSPVHGYGESLQKRVLNELVMPTMEGMRADGLRYRGFIFLGVRISDDGTPYLLEYNTRLGDPEAPCILSRLVGDFTEGLHAIAHGKLKDWNPVWDERHAVSVYAAAAGYPGRGVAGETIHMSCDVDQSQLTWADVSHARGQFLTGVGRTVLVTGIASELEDARTKAYEEMRKIYFSGMQCRDDIGSAGEVGC